MSCLVEVVIHCSFLVEVVIRLILQQMVVVGGRLLILVVAVIHCSFLAVVVNR